MSPRPIVDETSMLHFVREHGSGNTPLALCAASAKCPTTEAIRASSSHRSQPEHSSLNTFHVVSL